MALFITGDDILGWLVWVVHTILTIGFISVVLSGLSGTEIGGLMSAAEIEKLQQARRTRKKLRHSLMIFDGYILLTLLMLLMALVTAIGIISKFYIFVFWLGVVVLLGAGSIIQSGMSKKDVSDRGRD